MPQCVLGNIVTALIAEVFSAKMPAFILYALYTLFYFILFYLLICFCCCWQTVKAHRNSVAVNNWNSPTIQQQLCAWMCRYSRRSANIHITVWWTCVCVCVCILVCVLWLFRHKFASKSAEVRSADDKRPPNKLSNNEGQLCNNNSHFWPPPSQLFMSILIL